MSPGKSVLLLASFLALLALSPGCLSTASIGAAAYNGTSLLVQVTNAGGPGDAALQVNVYRIQDFQQVPVTRGFVPVRLGEGTGTYAIPLALDNGTFRLYLYVTTGNERRASVIQDITVASHGATPRVGTG
jgi:hypothetical protein